MALELTAVADVLEKLAVYVETVQEQKNASLREQRDKIVEAVRQKLSSVTGEDIPADVLSKLGETDPEVLSVFDKLAVDKEDGELGEPSQRKTASAPLNKDEAVERSGDRLVSFCVS